MKKEKFGILILTVLVLFISINFVSAQYPQIDTLVQQIKEASTSVFGPIFGHEAMDEFLFAKILLFLLIFSIVYMVLSKMDIFAGNKAVLVTVSTIFGILSVRYLQPNELINAILLPYGAFGAAITIFIPLLVFFMFLHTTDMGHFGRRAGWFIYGVIFLFLWGTRESDLGSANWIYILGIGFVAISFLFDKSIHRYFGLAGLERWRQNVDDARISNLQVEYNDLATTTTPSVHQRRRMKTIERELKRSNGWPP